MPPRFGRWQGIFTTGAARFPAAKRPTWGCRLCFSCTLPLEAARMGTALQAYLATAAAGTPIVCMARCSLKPLPMASCSIRMRSSISRQLKPRKQVTLSLPTCRLLEPGRTGWHSHKRISTLLFLRGRTALHSSQPVTRAVLSHPLFIPTPSWQRAKSPWDRCIGSTASMSPPTGSSMTPVAPGSFCSGVEGSLNESYPCLAVHVYRYGQPRRADRT